jgi:hypothetical protein
MADADLTQYNRVAADAEAENAANALTSQLLLITDNKLITGELNGAAQAPVNRGTKSLANKIAGLRGALWGNVAGIAKRSVKSFYADGTGGATHTKPDGNIHAAMGSIPRAHQDHHAEHVASPLEGDSLGMLPGIGHMDPQGKADYRRPEHQKDEPPPAIGHKHRRARQDFPPW